MSTQRTLVLLKPDTVRRGLVGDVLSRFEAKGLSIVALELRTIDAAQADEHYAEHVERDFYPPLRDFVTSGPLVAAVLEGDEAVEVVRALNGATDGRKAAPGTIRGDLSLSNRENLVHGSDSPESAEREIAHLVPGPVTRDHGPRRGPAALAHRPQHPAPGEGARPVRPRHPVRRPGRVPGLPPRASSSTGCRWPCRRCSPSTPTAPTRAARSTCTARSPRAAWCRRPARTSA